MFKPQEEALYFVRAKGHDLTLGPFKKGHKRNANSPSVSRSSPRHEHPCNFRFNNARWFTSKIMQTPNTKGPKIRGPNIFEKDLTWRPLSLRITVAKGTASSIGPCTSCLRRETRSAAAATFVEPLYQGGVQNRELRRHRSAGFLLAAAADYHWQLQLTG